MNSSNCFHSRARRLLALTGALAILAFLAGPAGAWGDKGHGMTARVAVRALPDDMPAFFRQAQVELGYLCPEPDRWRVERREPALRGAVDRDHTVKLEYVIEPLPRHRYEYVLQYAGKPKPSGGVFTWGEVGFAPYAIAERSEMLAVNFMLWRKAAESTDTERRIKRQIEQNIIYIAGLLGHFITDTAQPLHTSVHVDGWSPDLPNPKGYVGKTIHRRFETDYVNQAVEEQDFENLVARQPRSLGPWLEEALRHIRSSHGHVETVYALDAAHPFGSGSETAEAKQFTCRRLADASQALRDFWYSAWIKSATLPERNAAGGAARVSERARLGSERPTPGSAMRQ